MAQKRTELQKHIDRLLAGRTYRAAGEALGVDPTLLWRMHAGKRASASPKTLEKLGLRRDEKLVAL